MAEPLSADAATAAATPSDGGQLPGDSVQPHDKQEHELPQRSPEQGPEKRVADDGAGGVETYRCPDVTQTPPLPALTLHEAANLGDADAIKRLIDNGSSVLETDERGRTALWCAAEAGSVEAIRELILEGAVVDTVSDSEATPLAVAASNGHVPVVVELIKNGAIVTAQQTYGRTALTNAAQAGHLKVLWR